MTKLVCVLIVFFPVLSLFPAVVFPSDSTDKMALWDTGSGPHLRGANIYQRRVYPQLDGPSFMGAGPIGPPYTQGDFDRLAALGANYVNISHPGLFTETPPCRLDEPVQANLDTLLAMIAEADMFAVISFRTGPGRSEFTFFWDEVGDWFDASYLNDSIWYDQTAQNAWDTMWGYTAKQYSDHPIVIGYDLMVEPNSNEVCLDIWDPEKFYSDYGSTLYDWNQLYRRVVSAIRQLDLTTPILVGGMGYSAAGWLPYVQPIDDPRIVYTVHQYQPHVYTHQLPPLRHSYPGTFDTDWDGTADRFDRGWLEDLLQTVDAFKTTHEKPVAVNEFGIMRWEPGAAEFVNDQLALFEQQGLNYALWLWETSWEPYAKEVDAFNFLHDPDPLNHSAIASSRLMQILQTYWALNAIRPSTSKKPS